MTTYNNVLYQTDNGTGMITLNRPKALNALNSELLTELNGLLDEIAQDDSVKVIIITGSGDKAFVAGADIAEMQNMSPLEGRAFGKFGQAIFRKLEKSSAAGNCGC